MQRLRAVCYTGIKNRELAVNTVLLPQLILKFYHPNVLYHSFNVYIVYITIHNNLCMQIYFLDFLTCSLW